MNSTRIVRAERLSGSKSTLNSLPTKTLAICSATIFVVMSFAATAQPVTPFDVNESMRFGRVVRATAMSGYAMPTIIGRGDSTCDSIFILQGSRRDTIIIVAVVEPREGGKVHPIELERSDAKSGPRVRDITVRSFLGQKTLFDVAITNEPFMLETSYRFQMHHLIGRADDKLFTVCEVAGNSLSTTSKGMSTRTGTRTVTILRVPNKNVLTYSVKTVDESTEQENADSKPTITNHNEETKRFQIGPSGQCVEVKDKTD